MGHGNNHVHTRTFKEHAQFLPHFFSARPTTKINDCIAIAPPQIVKSQHKHVHVGLG